MAVYIEKARRVEANQIMSVASLEDGSVTITLYGNQIINIPATQLKFYIPNIGDYWLIFPHSEGVVCTRRDFENNYVLDKSA